MKKINLSSLSQNIIENAEARKIRGGGPTTCTTYCFCGCCCDSSSSNKSSLNSQGVQHGTKNPSSTYVNPS